MKNKNLVVLAVGAMIVLLLSIFVDWFVIRGHMASGLGASLTVIVPLPVWLVLVFGVSGVLLSLLNQLGLASVPRFLCLALLIVSSLYVFASLMLVGSSEVSLKIGPFLAMAGLALGYWHVFSASKKLRKGPDPRDKYKSS